MSHDLFKPQGHHGNIGKETRIVELLVSAAWARVLRLVTLNHFFCQRQWTWWHYIDQYQVCSGLMLLEDL